MSFSVKSLTLSLTFFHMLLFSAFGQVSIADSSIRLVTIDITYKGGLASGDWQDRWNFVSRIGLESGVKFSSNLYLQTGISFLFTDEVNNDTGLDDLLTNQGTLIITDEGFLSEVNVGGRGLSVPLNIGYIFPVVGPNPNSGIYLEAGGQFLLHRYNYRVIDGDASALEPPYSKGYDRQRSGIGFRQGIGYKYFANKNGVNFTIGLDFAQVPTVNNRTFFFPEGPLNGSASFLDLFWGIKFSWTYALYREAPSKAYFY
ncbi:MAG: hypothetical protein AAFY71_21000 [Bacteroidota bacterium]